MCGYKNKEISLGQYHKNSYRDPELFKFDTFSSEEYEEKHDIYSLGYFLMDLIVSYLYPFYNENI